MYIFAKIVHLIIHARSLAARSAAMSHIACIECQIFLHNFNIVTH